MHGHNYRVSVSLRGRLGGDAVVMDFGELKGAVRSLCGELDEHFLCAQLSPRVVCSVVGGQVELRVAGDGSFFSLPLADCAMLPIAGSSVEELARYLARRLVAALGEARLTACGATCLTLGVQEAPGQEARFSIHSWGPV